MRLVTLLPIPFILFQTAHAGPVQPPGLQVPAAYTQHRSQVVDMFQHSYAQYKQFAWGHDNLAPVSRSSREGRNGWGATIVDAMGTMHLMGLEDLLKEAIDFSSKIDFRRSKTPDTVSVFETTIRYLGGLLSTYELTNQQFPALLDQAKRLGDKMAFSWVGSNSIPYGHIDFENNRPLAQGTNIAEAGTLALEWATLSKHSGNNTYGTLAIRALRHIATQGTPLPGLAPWAIDPASGRFNTGYISWGGGSDSYFEYLIKHARLSNDGDTLYADTWATAVDSSIKHLLRTSVPGGHTYLGDYDDNKRLRHTSSHLACFHGGNFIYGGKLLNNQTIVDVGIALTDGCWHTYAQTQTGIGPESFGFISKDGNFTGPGDIINSEQATFARQHGFYPRSSGYILRPEVLESNFYAWRATGNTKYLDRAAAAIKSLNQHLRIDTGYPGLQNVNRVNGGFIDDMESFWFAETLKYLFLTFDDPARFSLEDWVFNTEAQPFKAPPAKPRYGSGIVKRYGPPFIPRDILPRGANSTVSKR